MQAIINGYAELLYGDKVLTKKQLATAKEQLETISKLPKVLAIGVNKDNSLVLHTDLITITPASKITYEIGHFQIIIDYRTKKSSWSTILFINKDRIIADTLAHPNCKIWDNNGFGIPCLGNIEDLMDEALRSRNFVLAAILCLRFLESYHEGHDAFGYNINVWPVYRKKE